MDTTLVRLKNSYLLIPIAVVIVLGLMKIDEQFSDIPKPPSDYVKAALVTVLLCFAFLYVHGIDDATFEMGQPGIPSF